LVGGHGLIVRREGEIICKPLSAPAVRQAALARHELRGIPPLLLATKNEILVF
jgi:hypothetical protein